VQPPSGAIHVLPSGFATNYCTNTAGVSFLCLRFAGPMLAVPAQAFPRAGNGTSLHFRASASSWAGAARKRSPWGGRRPRVPRCFGAEASAHCLRVHCPSAMMLVRAQVQHVRVHVCARLRCGNAAPLAECSLAEPRMKARGRYTAPRPRCRRTRPRTRSMSTAPTGACPVQIPLCSVWPRGGAVQDC
jgi:hypothetical protein